MPLGYVDSGPASMPRIVDANEMAFPRRQTELDVTTQKSIASSILVNHGQQLVDLT